MLPVHLAAGDCQLFGDACKGCDLGVELIQRNTILLRCIRTHIGLRGETLRQWCCCRIEAVQSRQAKNKPHGADEPSVVVLLRDRDPAPRVGRDTKCCRAVSIHMVDAQLGVILNHKNQCLRPELGLTDTLDDTPKCQIIIGNGRPRRWCAFTRTAGMVIWKQHDAQIWHFAFSFKAIHVLIEDICAPLIGDNAWKADEFRVHIGPNRGVVGPGCDFVDLASGAVVIPDFLPATTLTGDRIRNRWLVDKLSIDTEGFAGSNGRCPQKSLWRECQRIAAIVRIGPAMRIVVLLNIAISNSADRPLVAIRGVCAAGIGVIEEDKFTC